MNWARTSQCVGIAVAAVFLTGATPATQSASAPALKGGFVLNLAKFVEWPSDLVAPGAPLVLCVVDDSAVAEALAQTLNGRSVDGHGLTLRPFTAEARLPTCHVLYLAGSNPKRALDIVAGLNGALVLTVSDATGFAQSGGMVELFIQDGRMRFAVNMDAVERAHVRLSSRVLGLAKIVRDGQSSRP
jgi:hypothetical protein